MESVQDWAAASPSGTLTDGMASGSEQMVGDPDTIRATRSLPACAYSAHDLLQAGSAISKGRNSGLINHVSFDAAEELRRPPRWSHVSRSSPGETFTTGPPAHNLLLT